MNDSDVVFTLVICTFAIFLFLIMAFTTLVKVALESREVQESSKCSHCCGCVCKKDEIKETS